MSKKTDKQKAYEKRGQENQDLIKKTQDSRRAKSEKLMLEVLAEMAGADLQIADLFHIDARAKELVEDVLFKLDYESEAMVTARKLFLKTLLKEAMQNIPEPESFSGKDATAERNRRCEPIVISLLKKIFNPDLLLTDEEYIESAIHEQSEALFKLLIFGYFGAWFENTEESINKSLARCNDHFWGGRANKKTFLMVDKILKEIDTKPDK